MAISKVVYGGATLIDLTDDTVTADKLLQNIKAHGANGEKIIGTLEPGVDTSDATATAGDIAYQKTAYVNGEKITGTLADNGNGFNMTTSNVSTAMGAFVRLSAAAAEDQIVRTGDPININTLRSNFGDATAEDVAEGKTFTSAAGLMVTGTAVSPVTYTPLVYLESSGEQYIDTGISGGTNAAYELKFNVHNLVGQHYEHYFAGDYSTKVPRLYCVGGWNSVSASNPGSAAESHVVVEKSVNADHVLRYEPDGSLYVNGTLKYTMGDASDTGWGSLTWYLFNSHSEPGLKSIMKLYYLKMWTDGVLVRDFVPVQRVDGTCCLLDNVSGEFFENAGNGEFTGASATALAAEYAEALRIVGVSL